MRRSVVTREDYGIVRDHAVHGYAKRKEVRSALSGIGLVDSQVDGGIIMTGRGTICMLQDFKSERNDAEPRHCQQFLWL